MWRNAKRFAASAARDSLRRDMAPGVVPSLITVTALGGDHRSLGVRYVLRGGCGSSRPLFLNAQHSPLILQSIEVHAGTSGSTPAIRPMGSGNHLVVGEPGQSWEGVTIQMTLASNDPDSPVGDPCLVLPAALPQLETCIESADQAVLQVCGFAVAAAGIKRTDDESYLQAALVRNAAALEAAPDQADLLFTRSFASYLDAAEKRRLARLLSHICDFYSSVLSVKPSVRLLVGGQELASAADGAVLSFPNVQSLGLRTSAEPEDVMLGSRVARIWWGNGCRLTGSGARELEGAFRGALGMIWADSVDGPHRGGVEAALKRIAGGGALRDWWSGRTSGFRHRLHARWTLALYEGLRQEPGGIGALQTITRSAWSRYTPTAQVLDALRASGVLPPA